MVDVRGARLPPEEADVDHDPYQWSYLVRLAFDIHAGREGRWMSLDEIMRSTNLYFIGWIADEELSNETHDRLSRREHDRILTATMRARELHTCPGSLLDEAARIYGSNVWVQIEKLEEENKGGADPLIKRMLTWFEDEFAPAKAYPADCRYNLGKRVDGIDKITWDMPNVQFMCEGGRACSLAAGKIKKCKKSGPFILCRIWDLSQYIFTHP